MRNPGGYAIWVGEEGVLREQDTFTCCHCNTIVFVKPAAPPSESGGFCRLCMKPTCGPCADKGECTPFEKKLEAIERSDRLARAAGIVW